MGPLVKYLYISHCFWLGRQNNRVSYLGGRRDFNISFWSLRIINIEVMSFRSFETDCPSFFSKTLAFFLFATLIGFSYSIFQTNHVNISERHMNKQ
jgi:hypothetical protein